MSNFMNLVTADEAKSGGGNATIDGCNSNHYSFALDSSLQSSELSFGNNSIKSQSATTASDSSSPLSVGDKQVSGHNCNANSLPLPTLMATTIMISLMQKKYT